MEGGSPARATSLHDPRGVHSTPFLSHNPEWEGRCPGSGRATSPCGSLPFSIGDEASRSSRSAAQGDMGTATQDQLRRTGRGLLRSGRPLLAGRTYVGSRREMVWFEAPSFRAGGTSDDSRVGRLPPPDSSREMAGAGYYPGRRASAAAICCTWHWGQPAELHRSCRRAGAGTTRVWSPAPRVHL